MLFRSIAKTAPSASPTRGAIGPASSPSARASPSTCFALQVAAVPVRKVIESAITNARFKAERDGERFDENKLFITEVYADEGPTLKRFRPRAQGRAGRIRASQPPSSRNFP